MRGRGGGKEQGLRGHTYPRSDGAQCQQAPLPQIFYATPRRYPPQQFTRISRHWGGPILPRLMPSPPAEPAARSVCRHRASRHPRTQDIHRFGQHLASRLAWAAHLHYDAQTARSNRGSSFGATARDSMQRTGVRSLATLRRGPETNARLLVSSSYEGSTPRQLIGRPMAPANGSCKASAD